MTKHPSELPMKNGWIFHRFLYVYQRVNIKSNNLKHQLSGGTGEKIHAHLQLAGQEKRQLNAESGPDSPRT